VGAVYEGGLRQRVQSLIYSSTKSHAGNLDIWMTPKRIVFYQSIQGRRRAKQTNHALALIYAKTLLRQLPRPNVGVIHPLCDAVRK